MTIPSVFTSPKPRLAVAFQAREQKINTRDGAVPVNANGSRDRRVQHSSFGALLVLDDTPARVGAEIGGGADAAIGWWIESCILNPAANQTL